MINQNKLSSDTIARVNDILHLFSKESKEIRDLLVSYFPAMNMLKACHANSFEQFALIPLAREQGDSYKKDVLYDFKALKPPCIKCGENTKIRRRRENNYICSVCGQVYSANHNSIVSGSNVSSLVWMQVLLCMLNFYSIKETCDLCRITPTTYYKIRNRIFYAMQLMMDEVKLYGCIEIDNTFIHVNFKGTDLEENNYPEDSPFSFDNFIPRKARSRGGPHKMKDKNLNNICIFTAIDNYGHVMVKYAGIGITSTTKLSRMLNKDKFLLSVPEKDPFPYTFIKKDMPKHDTDLETLVVSDGEKALINYMNKLGLKTEHHVYRRNGVQLRLSSNAHNIQRVNQLHKKLKEFLQETNYVSTKYLPGFLTLFEFLETTKASDEAIGHLFEILAKPGLGKPSKYYKELFQTPNYIMEFSKDDNPLGKFSETQLYTVYLYEKFKRNETVDGEYVTVKEIAEITGYSTSSVRRLYKNFSASDLLPLVIKHFEDDEKNICKVKGTNTKKRERFTPEMLSVYDEYCKFRKLPRQERQRVPEFFESMNEKYNIHYSLEWWRRICINISKSGIRPPLPDWVSKEDLIAGYSPTSQNTAMKYLVLYEEITSEYLSKNLPLPPRDDILNVISSKTGTSPHAIGMHISIARRILKTKAAQEISED